ncbi:MULTISPECIES: DUF4097 family beta strand repeat-containing protein [Streptomyces]|uniref:DUF4097 family beta strand repeat-containing protein n=1 Tax=Streptomyces solicathayae TaxID=3081768 RepID=A0ABZ0LYR5_9ACTN|nr:DUF4097 family beta strand repeat-containing protein [Streptomyces sp. HUAS YS2]WOX24588.1 DUF4097 family beta strand repeat-containing protein [Streptomyces sp. HUAS YS2]
MAAHRIRTFLATGGVVIGALGVTGCGSADVGGAPVERKNFAFSGDALTVDSDNSDLEIVPGDVTDIRVTRQVDGWVFLGEGPNPTWRMEGSKLVLRVECDAVASNCGARHTVTVPRGVAVTVEDQNGDMTLDGFATPLTVRSENGDVRIRNQGGPLDLGSENGDVHLESGTLKTLVARTENGDVAITLRAVPEKVEVSSDNGDVDLRLPRGSSYDVAGSSNNGDLSIDVPNDKASTHQVSARSENGDVAVRAAN